MKAIRRPLAVLSRHRPWPLSGPCAGVALDMGSARTRAWVAGRGSILDVPTVTFPGAGAVYPIQRGAIVDAQGAARMLDRLLGHRLPLFARPLVVVTAPVLDGPAYRSEARTVVEVLRPRGVLTVPAARAVAVAAGADLSRPLLVMDVGAHLTEVVLLVDGAVHDARRTALGTVDIDEAGPDETGRDEADPSSRICAALVDMTASMLRQDDTCCALDALNRGPLLAGGGALRPEIAYRLADGLNAPLQPVPAPHTAAVRGAAALLRAAQTHPASADAGTSDGLSW